MGLERRNGRYPSCPAYCNGRAISGSNPPGPGGVSVVGVELTAAYELAATQRDGGHRVATQRDEVRAIADAAPDRRTEERALVARAQAGDLEAFEVL